MKGILYGVGVGPGDPELITLKAINTIKKSDVIAFPTLKKGQKAAFDIVKEYLQNKELIECYYSMSPDLQERKLHRKQAAEKIVKCLEKGLAVSFITLGDPAIYSTFAYIEEIIAKKGFETQTVPGITSFSLAASIMKKPLCTGEDNLHIIAAINDENINNIPKYSGNKIIMKAGRQTKKVVKILEENGLSENTNIMLRGGMEGTKIFYNIDEFNKNTEQKEYFSIIFVEDKNK